MIKTFDGLPTHCEYCGSELVWDKVNDHKVDLICANPTCPHNSYEQVKAWCMSIAPIENLGWKTIEKKLNQYFPDFDWTIGSLYELDTSVIIGGNYAGSEDTLFRQMFRKLELGTVTVSQFLLALNIPGLGKIGAKAVENNPNVENIIMSLAKMDFGGSGYNYEDVVARLIQDKNAAHELFSSEVVPHYLRLVNFDYNNYEMSKTKGTIVITGTLSVKRDDFIKVVEKCGWKVTSKVTADVDYLITDNPDSGTSKNKDADKFGVKKLTEEQFRNIMNIIN